MINWDMFKAIHNNKEVAFEQLCYYLFCDEFSQRFGIVRYKNQPSLETNPIDINGENIGFQAKFFSTTISSHVVELKDCISSAATKYSPLIDRLVFYLSEEFSASTNSNKVKPAYQQDIENHALQYNIKIDWRFRSNIEQQLMNPALEHIRNYYFPESFDSKAEKITTEETGASFHIGRFVKLNNTQSKHSLLEALDLNNRIILLGDAALGKSEELIHLHNFLLHNENYLQYYYRLRNYRGENIKDIIPVNYDRSLNTVLLFDAFDEIDPVFSGAFIKKINTFCNKYKHIKIIISSRYNFFISDMFENFATAHLMELNEEDFTNLICLQLNTKARDFIEKTKQFADMRLLTNPFYLLNNIELYRADNNVYDMLGILQVQYDRIFNKDKDKFIFTNVTNYKQELLNILSDLSLIFVNNGLTDIDLTFFKNFNVNIIHNIKSFGWIVFNESKNNICFLHNNYKEYLAALALNAMSFDDIKNIISLTIEETYIRPQFNNTLGFLLKLQGQKSPLKDYLLKCGKEILIDADNISLSADEKLSIVKSIIEESNSRQSWLDEGRFKEEKIAKICDSIKVVDYLINLLELSLHRTTIISVLNILKNIKNLYLKQDEIKRKIYILLDNVTILSDYYLVSTLLRALADLGITNDEAVKLYLHYSQSPKSSVRAAANYIAYKNKLGGILVKYLLRGRKNLRIKAHWGDVSADEDITDAGESYYISLALKEITDTKALCEYADYILNEEKKMRENYLKEEFLEKILSLDTLDRTIVEVIYNVFLRLRSYQFRGNEKNIKDIINKFNLSEEFFDRMKTSPINAFDKLTLLALIYCDNTKDKIVNLFYKNKILYDNRDYFVNCLCCYVENINEIIEWFRSKGISLRLTRHERETKEEMRKQQSFASLFDESKTKAEIEKVFSNFQTTVITPKNIRKLLYSTRELYPTFVMNFFTGQEEISLDSMRKSDLEFFRIHEIFDMLNSKIIKLDNVTQEQKDYLYKWCCKELPKVDFKNATKKTESSYSINWYAIIISFFSFCFEFDYDKKVYEDIIYFDWWFFDDYKHDNIINYLVKKITKEDLNQFVIAAITSGELKYYVLEYRIEYCANNGLKEILGFVIGLLGDSTKLENALFRSLLNYLSAVNQLEDCLHFYNKYSLEFKHLVLAVFIDKNNTAILPYIECDIRTGENDKDLISFANTSMRLNSKVGIEYFINWCEKNKIIYGDDFYEMDFSTLNSIDDLQDLMRLLDLSYRFKKKRRLDSFMSRINDALLGIAIQSLSNLKAVTQTLKQFIANSNHKDVSYQYWSIDRMIKKFLDNNQCIKE